MLAISLDIGKIVTVSFLYKNWKQMNFVMRSYMTVATVVLMTVTSSGAAGYLSAEFQKAIIPTKNSDIVLSNVTEEKTRLQARKEEIDKQIAQLPPNYVKARKQLMQEFSDETIRINKRLAEIDTQLPDLQLKQVDVEAHAGPVLYISKAFDISVEEAVKYVILLIIFVFDPLAISLIIAGNFLIEKNKSEKDEITSKLDKIQREVSHIEEEIEHPRSKELHTSEDQLVPDYPDNDFDELYGESVTLPKVEIQNDSEELLSAQNKDVHINVSDLELNEEEQIQTPHVQEEPIIKKRRNEPIPSIRSEEDLNKEFNSSGFNLTDVMFGIDEAVEEELTPAEAEKKIRAELNNVDHKNADVRFFNNDERRLSDKWSSVSTKEALKLYDNK